MTANNTKRENHTCAAHAPLPKENTQNPKPESDKAAYIQLPMCGKHAREEHVQLHSGTAFCETQPVGNV